ncbi:MAG TPA: hypothetical protein VJG83_05410 [archaeon]|nr:hypothetical protein [archaeon]
MIKKHGRPAVSQWLKENAGLKDPVPSEFDFASKKYKEVGLEDTGGDELKLMGGWNKVAPHFNRILGF